MHPLIAILNTGRASLNGGPWGDIAIVSPTTVGSNTDLQVQWNGGSGGGTRTVKNSWNSGGTLEYRIDAGTWTTYTPGSAGFTITNGQTIGWRITLSSNLTATDAIVSVNGVPLDTFQISASGFP